MGQGLSCREPNEHGIFSAVQNGELEIVEAMVDEDPSVLGLTTAHGKLSILHVAAANGRIEVLSMLLDRSVNPDILNRRKQTPLMLAALHGMLSCVERLIRAGANTKGSCLCCIYGICKICEYKAWKWCHSIAFRSPSRTGRVCPPFIGQWCSWKCLYCCPASSPLHLAARGGFLDCVRELLAWGADRLQRDYLGIFNAFHKNKGKMSRSTLEKLKITTGVYWNIDYCLKASFW